MKHLNYSKSVKKLTITLTMFCAMACSSSPSHEEEKQTTPYEKIEIVFDGHPTKEEIQPMLESVLDKYHLNVNDENILKLGDVLLTLKKSSKLGVTEMEILKHMYQHGSNGVELYQQAAISATYLETTK